MTEPGNDPPLHETVRQRLATHQPPFDPANWQRMRRRLRRERWRPVGWCVLVGLFLLGIGWYVNHVTPDPVDRISRVATSAPAKAIRANPAARPVSRVATRLTGRASNRTRPVTIPMTVSVWSPAAPGQVVGFLQHPRLAGPAGKPPALPPVVIHSPAEAEIIRQVTTGDIGSDSTTYRVLSRNLARWPNAVVVCDFTSSMYPYSTQLMTWFRKNQAATLIKGIVFFTDCDSLGHETEPGQPGQLFVTRSRTVADVLPLMLASARNTMGNRLNAENNVGPLAYAQRQFPEASEFILVADNSSRVKDIDRLADLHRPVHIILCGPTYDSTRAFQPDYYAIARQTGGSLHTLEDDLTNVGQLRSNTWIRVDDRYYRLNRRGHFVSTRFRHRPKRLFGLFWH